jgi:hypothetical protein
MNDSRSCIIGRARDVYFLHEMQPTSQQVAGEKETIHFIGPFPVATLSKAWDYGRSLAETAGSNRVGNMDVCLSSVLSVVK